jgi:hypothetical protein
VKDDLDFKDPIDRDLAARKAARILLGVSESANAEQLKNAYRRAARECHPDHNANSEEANRKFALVKCAYELLAFDMPCEALLTEVDSKPGASGDDKYNLDNPWGHFCWWRERFFE